MVLPRTISEVGRDYGVPCDHATGCGCDGIAACCLDCHLPMCRYEIEGGLMTIGREQRREAILRLREQGLSHRKIAEILEVAPRTVLRTLKAKRERKREAV